MTHREAISISAFFTSFGLEGGPRNQRAGGGQGAGEGEEIESNNAEEKKWERRAESGGGRGEVSLRPCYPSHSCRLYGASPVMVLPFN